MPTTRSARRAAAAATLLALTASAPALAAGRTDPGKVPPDFDVRVPATPPRTSTAPADKGPGAAGRRAAQAELRSSLGRSGVVDTSRVTGTARSVGKLSGTLTAASSAAPATVARGWAREHAAALGLSAADVDALGTPRTVKAPGGLVTLRFPQAVDGIPAFDSELRASLDAKGRLITVGGAPARGLRLATTTPKLGAAEALAVLGRSVGATDLPAVAERKGGPRQATRFANGDIARLVAFVTDEGALLAWHVTLQAGTRGAWDGVVDATGGRLLRRASLVDHAAVTTYYPRYPGAPAGGAPVTVDLGAQGWLDPAEKLLRGPSSRAYSDVDASDDPSDEKAFDEEVRPSTGNPAKSFDYGLTLFNGTSANTQPPNCETFAPCTWDSTKPTSWRTNRAEATMQSFVYVNLFHDFLEAAPIGFDEASGSFDGDDPVLTESDDGANTSASGGPLPQFLNNANMSTPPDGQAPRMQMYLGSINAYTDDAGNVIPVFRDNNNGEDAATVYHEYTHGLSNRLVTTADGSGALGAQQSGSMGEAWSDFYAFDYLNRQGYSPDTATPGEQDLGDFTDATQNQVRTQPLDCPLLAPGERPSDPCNGTEGAGPGGYTYGDFGKVLGFAEVHADGEIWGETLWDLRLALIQQAGSTAGGADLVEALVTGGMRLSPPSPSFLDERNAILQADTALFDGAHQALIWSVFAKRGMGYFASTTDATDAAPIEDFSTPPAADTPRGTLTGRVTDLVSGLPVAGALVGVGGQSTPGYAGALAARTDADGRYSFTAPVHVYPSVLVQPGNGYFNERLADVAVTAGGTTVRDQAVRRSLAVGAPVTTNNNTGGAYACGIEGLTDGDLGSVWEVDLTSASPADPLPQAVVDLGSARSITAYGLDPAEGCGSGPGSATGKYRLESSTDGTTWTPVKEGEFGNADRHRLNEVLPPEGARTARYVRLTLLTTQGDDSYWDFAELAVFGADANVLPTGTLEAPASATPGQEVPLRAAFTDPDSAITGYDWDFDGDGTVDRTTAEPTTTTSYGSPGTRTVVVRAKDFRGGAGSARASIAVATPTPPAGPGITPPKPPAGPAAAVEAARVKAALGEARARVSCAGSCRVGTSLVVSSATRKKARLKFRTLVSTEGSVTGLRNITVRVPASKRRSLRRAGFKTVLAQMRVTVTPTGGKPLNRTLLVRIRL